MLLRGRNIAYWYETTGGSVYPASDTHYITEMAIMTALEDLYEVFKVNPFVKVYNESGGTLLFRQEVYISGVIDGYLYTAKDRGSLEEIMADKIEAVADDSWVTIFK